jgi:hypothetical protein
MITTVAPIRGMLDSLSVILPLIMLVISWDIRKPEEQKVSRRARKQFFILSFSLERQNEWRRVAKLRTG